MSIDTSHTTDATKELAEVIARLNTRSGDSEAMRKARQRMDQMREDLRQRIGTVEVAVDLVRDARNS
jgi:predicted nucleotide-binding protein (sugar kinase/HSP70/actin superfamily)